MFSAAAVMELLCGGIKNQKPKKIYTTSKSVRGPLRECPSSRSGASGPPYYCAPLVCVSAVIDSLGVWRHNKPKTKTILWSYKCTSICAFLTWNRNPQGKHENWNVEIKHSIYYNSNESVILYVYFVLFIDCLYICVCECQLQNNNQTTKHKNNTNCGSAFEPGASLLLRLHLCAFLM